MRAAALKVASSDPKYRDERLAPVKEKVPVKAPESWMDKDGLAKIFELGPAVVRAMWRCRPGTPVWLVVSRRITALLISLALTAYSSAITAKRVWEAVAPKQNEPKHDGPAVTVNVNVPVPEPSPLPVGNGAVTGAAWNVAGVAGPWNAWEPVVVTFQAGAETPEITDIRIDGEDVGLDPRDYNIVPVPNGISILPRHGYWYIGQHYIRVWAKFGGKVHHSVGRFLVDWRCLCSRREFEPYLSFDPDLVKPTVTFDENGNLLIDAATDRTTDPAELKFRSFVPKLRPFTLGLRMRMDPDSLSAFQASLPGKISVQIADGARHILTVKIGGRYLARDAKSLTHRRRDAMEISLRNEINFATEGWLYLSYAPSCLVISTGEDGSNHIGTIKLPAESLKEHWNACALRSYGPAVHIMELKVGPILSQFARPLPPERGPIIETATGS